MRRPPPSWKFLKIDMFDRTIFGILKNVTGASPGWPRAGRLNAGMLR